MDKIIRCSASMLAVVVLVTAVTATTATTNTSVTIKTSTRQSTSFETALPTTETATEEPAIVKTTAATTTATTTTAATATTTVTSQTNQTKSQVKKVVSAPGNCPLGMVWREGNQVIMLATLMKGSGAAFARTSCLSRGARPLFLNTQQDADLLHRILRDCDKSDRLGGVWVPVRRHQQLKKIMYSQKAAWMTSSANSGKTVNSWEFDWLNAKFDWYTGNVMLHPFPKDVTLEGIICVKNV